MRNMLPAVVFSIFATLLAYGTTLAAPPTGEMAVVFPPFTDEMDAWASIRAAGARIVGPTRLGNVVVVYAATADFQARARAQGAFLFVKAEGLCAPLSPESAA